MTNKIPTDTPSQHKVEQLKSIIELLSDGGWHTGPGLAQRLKVSRAYVWKLIQQLQEYGLALESISGKGYRLKQHLNLLQQGEINQQLSEDKVDAQVFMLADSTNQLLKDEGFCHKRLIIAEYQSAGRGRRGRNWVSPIAANLYWSLGWQTQMPVQKLGGLSLVVGLSLVSALEQLGYKDLALKWPNDLRYQGKKLAGILVELSGDASGDLNVIIGVGLNVQMDQSTAQEIEQAWMSLSELADEQGLNGPNRQQVLIGCVKHLNSNLALFEEFGFEHFLSKWQEYDESFDQQVSILQANSKLQGLGAGVDSSGAFLLQTDSQLETIYAGEVSLRINQ